jgi:hypothetical protein
MSQAHADEYLKFMAIKVRRERRGEEREKRQLNAGTDDTDYHIVCATQMDEGNGTNYPADASMKT